MESTIISFILNTWFIWLPIILGFFFMRTYRVFKLDQFVYKKMSPKNYKMLEINIPHDVHKSPLAMELIIDVLWHLGGGAMSWKDRLWYGAALFPGSLEIISVEGSIYFFIRAHVQVADLVKSTLYSQYPQAEVNEVDDYTKYVPDYTKHENTWDLYGADFTLSKESFIPIKTYVDYGLDKAVGTLEEEQKIDPITPFLEFLGTLGKGEQIWVQFIVRADVFNSWRKDAAEFIKEMVNKSSMIAGDDEASFQALKMTHGEQEQIKAIERSLSKYAFETKIRALYLAPKENFNKGRVGFFKNNVFKPFASQYLNLIKRNGDTGAVDYVWEDSTGLRTPALKRRFFNDYIKREAFYEGIFKYINFLWYKKNSVDILTSEELATLFHIPGRVSETASIDRIDSKKTEPPTNLPV